MKYDFPPDIPRGVDKMMILINVSEYHWHFQVPKMIKLLKRARREIELLQGYAPTSMTDHLKALKEINKLAEEK